MGIGYRIRRSTDSAGQVLLYAGYKSARTRTVACSVIRCIIEHGNRGIHVHQHGKTIAVGIGNLTHTAV